ncbi:hypothetical protein evm_005848, partial [Chilo suppressalis]
MLGMEVRSDLNPKDNIETLIKTASRKLGVLNKVRRFFTPDQLCLLYKTQVRSCVEYCSRHTPAMAPLSTYSMPWIGCSGAPLTSLAMKRESISLHERLSATLRFLATGRCYEFMKFSRLISPQALGQIEIGVGVERFGVVSVKQRLCFVIMAGKDDDEVILQTFMIKRSQNKKLFTPVNFKGRWVVLKRRALAYYDSDGE